VATAVRNALLFGAFVAGYLLLDWVSYIHPLQTLQITPWNPQPALAIALLMLRGQRWLPAVAFAILAAEVVVRGAPHAPGAMLLIAVVLALGYGAIAQAMVGPFAVRPRLDRRADLARLVGVVVVGTLFTAGLFIAALWATDIGPRGDYVAAAIKFWIGDCVGILVTLPLLLMASDAGRRHDLVRVLREPLAVAQALAIAGVLWVVFGWFGAEPFKFFYLLFLPLVWVAARLGMPGATIAVALIQAGVIAGVMIAGVASITVFELQALQMALAITGFLLGVTVDERERAAEQMRRTSRLASAGRMAAALAHELNQPLTALASYSKAGRLLASAPNPDLPRLDATLAKAAAEAHRAADIVQRVRDLFAAGQPELQAAQCRELVDSAVAAVHDRAASAGVAIATRVPDALPPLRVDPVQIDLVLRNLLANAIEAVATADSAERTVEVGAAQSAAGSRDVRLWVRDSGPGVAPEVLDQLFEPLVSSKPTGMGMGLALSRAIVEAHGGHLDYVAADGQFVLQLPATTEPAPDA
jgi:signal transduction histidine kinase